MRASELAYKAAKEMAERGHCKQVSEDEQGRVCLFGALSRAGGNIRQVLPAPAYPDWVLSATYVRETEESLVLLTEIRGILREREVPECETPHLYNDREDITGEDIILLFKEAGARLEARGC